MFLTPRLKIVTNEDDPGRIYTRQHEAIVRIKAAQSVYSKAQLSMSESIKKSCSRPSYSTGHKVVDMAIP